MKDSKIGHFLVTIVLVLILDKCQSSPLTTFKPDQALIISTSTVPSTESGESTEQDIDNVAKPSPSAVVSKEDASDELGPLPVPEKIEGVEVAEKSKSSLKPDIYSFKIHSDITYRYARTYVTSRVVNANPTDSQEVTFRVILPETAFISKFIMEIDGKPYEAYVKEKEEAKRVYNEAQSQGQSAGLVELNTRNANVFDVNVNIKSQSKVNFNLTYEELLSRRLGRYEQSISITPEQITNVKDFQITVNIEESQNFTLLRVPNLRNDVDAPADSEGNNQDAVIERPSGNKASISWKPSDKDQSQLAKQGVTGKFIVQYDIKRELDAGEVLVMNGYFVHFFAPENLPPLRKHVVFVLDTSGSMWGRRIEQLKEAMNQILADLTPDDFFNILTFSSDVVLWSPDDKISASSWSPPPFHGERVVTSLEDPRRRQPYPATKENIEKAQKFIQSLVASGGTNIHDSIVQALNLTAAIKKNRAASPKNVTDEPATTATPETTTVGVPAIGNTLPANVESLLMFLTDGEATVGITNPTSIVTLIQEANKNISVPIFALGFGSGTDFPLIRKIALQNSGFARKIYEAADAAIQLKGFYKEIASPLLSNVKFNYTTPESAYTVENVTITRFPTVFRGNEIAVAGRLVPKPILTPELVEEPATTNQAITEIPTEQPEPVSDTDHSDSLLTPTTQSYFDVEIRGSGRDGEMLFLKPEIFSCIIPWDVHVVRPFPPRPTPPPTQEDVFLERLWAYLTIQQLIEKDLAQNSKENEVDQEDGYGDSFIPLPSPTTVVLVDPVHTTTLLPATSVNETTTVVPDANRNTTATVTVVETPKQKALRLALKYGFVTSLTSLVVVKPNSSDVTNAVAADASPDSADSLASGGGFTANRIVAGGGHYANAQGIMPVSLSRPSFAAYRPGMPGLHGIQYATTTYRPFPIPSATYHPMPMPVQPVQEEADYDQLESEIISSSAQPSTQGPTATPPLPSQESSATPSDMITTTAGDIVVTTMTPAAANLTLKDIKWFNGSPIKVGDKEYAVVEDESVQVANPRNCTVAGNGEAGPCVHLKDCVQEAFLDNFDLYSLSYFCPVDSSDPIAAGVCCVRTTEKSI